MIHRILSDYTSHSYQIKADMKPYLMILRDAVIACLIMASAGIIINAIRPDGLPFIAEKPYDIFVPCPETLGKVELMLASDERIKDGKSFVVDARTQEEFVEWHYQDAINITYDYLEPISDDELKNVTYNIINSGKERLIVYGDGDGRQGSTGYELGRELAGHGIQHVFVIDGGANKLRGN